MRVRGTVGGWMLRNLVVLAVAMTVLTSCASPEPSQPPHGPSVTPAQVRTVVPGPTIQCGDINPTDCAAAIGAALAVSTGAKDPPASVLMGSGIWWPSAGSICNDSTCPAWESPSPDRGRWIGHALVDYPDSSARAFINISKHGDAVSAVLVALATPAPGPSDPGPT